MFSYQVEVPQFVPGLPHVRARRLPCTWTARARPRCNARSRLIFKPSTMPSVGAETEMAAACLPIARKQTNLFYLQHMPSGGNGGGGTEPGG